MASIEAEAERLYASERGLMDADSQSRDRLYQRAQQVCRGHQGDRAGSARVLQAGFDYYWHC